MFNYKVIHITIISNNLFDFICKNIYFVLDRVTESRPLSEIDPDMQKLDGEDSENSNEQPKEEPKIITIVNKS